MTAPTKEQAELLLAAKRLIQAASNFGGKPPNRNAYTTSGLGKPFEQLCAAVAAVESTSDAELPVGEPVAEVESFTNGSYSRHYKVRWLRDVPEGTKLYARLSGERGE